jgi:hypothetical protein
MVIPLGNLGSHPMHILGNAIVFDHYCHLRHDIGAAVERAASLPRDPEALRSVVEWMMIGVPQMCADALAGCTQGIDLAFTDVPAGDGVPLVWTLRPADDGAAWVSAEGTTAGLPTVTTTAHDFVSWGTKRIDWRSAGVEAEGAVAVTLDAINVI